MEFVFFLSTGCFVLVIIHEGSFYLGQHRRVNIVSRGRWLVNQTDFWVCFALPLISSSGRPVLFFFFFLVYTISHITEGLLCASASGRELRIHSKVYLSKIVELWRSDRSSGPQRSTRKDFNKLVCANTTYEKESILLVVYSEVRECVCRLSWDSHEPEYTEAGLWGNKSTCINACPNIIGLKNAFSISAVGASDV